MSTDLSFPRQQARTRRFSLGRPRAVTIREDGAVLFLRSRSGEDPVTELWLQEVDGTERRLVDPADLDVDEQDLPPEERARRERAREQAGGIVAFTADRSGGTVAFAVGGRLFILDTHDGAVRAVPGEGVFAPVVDPTGARVCWVADGALWVGSTAPAGPAPVRRLHDADPDVTWGAAEFVAAEEMGRMRGVWWSPDGTRLAVARVDARPVDVWRISDPSRPAGEPATHRYPPAGGENARVSLHVVTVDGDDQGTPVAWDADAFEYLAVVTWGQGEPLTLLVQSRDQRRAEVRTVDPEAGTTTLVDTLRDDAWVALVPGTPAWVGDRLVLVRPDGRGDHGTDALHVGASAVTPTGLQVRSVLGTTDDGAVWFTASGDDPGIVHVHAWHADRDLDALTTEPGVHGAVVRGETVVVARSWVDGPARVVVRRGGEEVELASLAADPVVTPAPRFLRLGERRLPAALLLPSDDDGTSRLPIVLDPYGGPGHGRVVHSREAFLASQWLADQGFAVLVVDNAGAPGLGPRWERELLHDLATPVLADQVAALHAAAALEPRLDLDRVALRGWSFGGFLAALAVLRRPDVFRAGIAGAPVTDWALYDTHYTERYLGRPQDEPRAYAVSSLVDADGQLLGAVDPPDPARPPRLQLIHGLADDNVVAAHSLRLSGALLAAGRPHEFLPLTGVTHMTPQEVVAEHLLLLQVEFLRRALA